MAGPQCCVPAPLSLHRDPSSAGLKPHQEEELVASFLSYVVSPPSGSNHRAVILISDIFGYGAPLLRKLADKIATFGYYVIVPDFFDKDPFVSPGGDNEFAALAPWMAKHDPVESADSAKQVIEALNRKGFSSVGIVGFCWGAKVAVQIAKGDSVKSVVLCHPSFVTVEDIQEVKTAIAILAAEKDLIIPAVFVQQFADILASKTEVESFVRIYPGVQHGWTCRYDADDEQAVEKANEAHTKILEWLGKYL